MMVMHTSSTMQSRHRYHYVPPRSTVSSFSSLPLPSSQPFAWSYVCGVTNWLLSLTGYGSKWTLPYSSANFLTTQPAVSRPIVAVHWLCFGNYSIPLSCFSGISWKHLCTYMWQILLVQVSTTSFVLCFGSYSILLSCFSGISWKHQCTYM